MSVEHRKKATAALAAITRGDLGEAIWEARDLLNLSADCDLFLPADDPLHETVAVEIEAWMPIFEGVLAGATTVGELRAWLAKRVETSGAEGAERG